MLAAAEGSDPSDIGFLSLACDKAGGHHETWDGSGHPAGLAGDVIPIAARLMAVADIHDALICKRVYKPAFPHDKAMAIIRKGRGRHFDPDVVDALLAQEKAVLASANRCCQRHTAGRLASGCRR